MKIWAVGLKEWVQLRESKEAPRAIPTEASRPSVEVSRTPIYSPSGAWTGRMKSRKVKKEFTIKIVAFEGGKVKATLKRRSFTEKTGISIKEGDVREVPPSIANVLIADDWSQKIPQELGGPL